MKLPEDLESPEARQMLVSAWRQMLVSAWRQMLVSAWRQMLVSAWRQMLVSAWRQMLVWVAGCVRHMATGCGDQAGSRRDVGEAWRRAHSMRAARLLQACGGIAMRG